jgi:hypothetical protein
LNRSDGELDKSEILHFGAWQFPIHQMETYEVSCPARIEFGFAFFGFNALRFIVAVIAGLAFALVPDLNSASDASVRSRENIEPPLKSELFATNKPHAALDLTVWNAGPTAKAYAIARDLDNPYMLH